MSPIFYYHSPVHWTVIYYIAFGTVVKGFFGRIFKIGLLFPPTPVPKHNPLSLGRPTILTSITTQQREKGWPVMLPPVPLLMTFRAQQAPPRGGAGGVGASVRMSPSPEWRRTHPSDVRPFAAALRVKHRSPILRSDRVTMIQAPPEGVWGVKPPRRIYLGGWAG